VVQQQQQQQQQQQGSQQMQVLSSNKMGTQSSWMGHRTLLCLCQTPLRGGMWLAW
jgi:hypothetical protein